MQIILLLCNDNALAAVICSLLQTSDLHIITVKNEARVLHTLRAVQCSVLIIAGTRAINIEQLACESKLWRPNLKIAVLTGGAPVSANGVDACLHMPFTKTQLTALLQNTKT